MRRTATERSECGFDLQPSALSGSQQRTLYERHSHTILDIARCAQLAFYDVREEGEKELNARAAKCCCGDGFFFDFPTKKCEISLNVGFMFGRLNNGWSHVVVYGFTYPILVISLIAPLCAVMVGMRKREKREGDRRYGEGEPCEQARFPKNLVPWATSTKSCESTRDSPSHFHQFEEALWFSLN
ncbi:hypothetical protein KIN20_000895 [Parelaphostrongylus tenuis]|uniref:Uncharacterized protein n=1 Tax=Parelaphostrongylus tenuis TaxID=148309 RepID=A0AAD5LVD9_PARTN|nr:hypothetical protein KIN20_000895 [Parelaphostrongylus tenuis]